MLRIRLILYAMFIFVYTNAQEIKNNMPHYVDKMLQKHDYALKPEGFRSTKQWKKQARKVLFDAVGKQLPDTALTYQITDTEQRDGYSVNKITYTLSSWHQGKAYLLIPNGCEKAPAMLMLHDHGAHFTIGKEKLVRPVGVDSILINDAEQWVTRYYNGVFLADEYARRGYVVLVADALLWGERQVEGGTKYADQQAIAHGMMKLGYSLGGMMLQDDMRALQLLCSLPYVDKERVGCMGFSMGAYRAWMLSAAMPQIKATAAICWMTTMESQMTPPHKPKGGSDYSMFIPDLNMQLDYPHIAAMISPRALLLINGREDKLFAKEGVEQAYAIIKRVYVRENAQQYLTTEWWDEAHCFNKNQQKATKEFFLRYLGL